jgi:hypothetical protein
MDRRTDEALDALWLVGNAVLGNARPQDDQAMDVLREALDALTWFIEDLDPDLDIDPESEAEAFLESMARFDALMAESKVDHPTQGATSADSPSTTE